MSPSMVSHQEAKNEKIHFAATSNKRLLPLFCKFAEPSRTCHEDICETSKVRAQHQSNNKDGRLMKRQKLLRLETFFFYFKNKRKTNYF